jgi:hypothetical protein
MSAMRRLLLLCLPVVALAEDAFQERLQAFEAALPFTLEAGGQARVYPAVEALAATGDIRAVAPLAAYLLETITGERHLLEDARKTQKEAAESSARAETLTKELKQLELKEKAGDRTVGPAIELRVTERSRCQHQCEQLMKVLEQKDRTIGFLRELRGRLADSCISLLKGRKGADAATGIEGVRRALDPADRDQGLFLVRILGASDVAEAEGQLLEILSAPKADEAVRLRAQYALAKHLTRRGAETLLRLWERDPERAGEHARHVLSLAAKRKLETLADARAWVASLP